jgi:WD domain, G-beta repeat
VEASAEAAYDGLTENQQTVARDMFRQLSGPGIAVKRARTTADQQRTTDVAQRLTGQSMALDATDPVMASLLATAAWRLAPTAQTRYGLLQSLAQPVRGVLTAQSGVVTALAYSPDGTTVAAGYSDGTIRLWNLASHRLMGAATWGAAPLVLAFTSGGRVLQVADDVAVGTWNLSNGATITALPLTGASGGTAVAFSPDRTTLATASGDGTIRTWDVAFPAKLAQAACAIADVSLTREQWADYAGTQPFQQVCPAS